jgi:hypothetical protein
MVAIVINAKTGKQTASSTTDAPLRDLAGPRELLPREFLTRELLPREFLTRDLL